MGGATTFTKADIFVKPRPGMATFFSYKVTDYIRTLYVCMHVCMYVCTVPIYTTQSKWFYFIGSTFLYDQCIY